MAALPRQASGSVLQPGCSVFKQLARPQLGQQAMQRTGPIGSVLTLACVVWCTGKLTPLSEQELVDCDGETGNAGERAGGAAAVPGDPCVRR